METVFYIICFLLVGGIVFPIVQIPFAMIHKYAVWVFLFYQEYLTAVFFAMMVRVGVEQEFLSPVILLIIMCATYLITRLMTLERSELADTTIYILILKIIGVILIPLIYYFNFLFAAQPVLWFFKLMKFLFELPVIGKILTFILQSLSGFSVIFGILIIIIIISKISSFFTKK